MIVADMLTKESVRSPRKARRAILRYLESEGVDLSPPRWNTEVFLRVWERVLR